MLSHADSTSGLATIPSRGRMRVTLGAQPARVARARGARALRLLVLLGACAGGDLAGTSPEPSEIAAIRLTPEAADVEPGDEVQFGAAAMLLDGSTETVSVSYTTTGGAITPGGLFTAGQDDGTFRVIATHAATGFADTAFVTIATPPPGGGSDVAECDTPQSAWLWCDDFEQDRLASYFEYDDAGGTFARTAGVGRDGSVGMRARFAAGQSSAGSLHLAIGKTPQAYFRPVDAGTAIHREVYWRMYLRHESGWTGGGADKLSRVTSFASTSTWAQAMIAHVWAGTAPEHEYLTLDPASGTDASGNLQTTTYNDFANLRWLGIARSQTPVYDAAHVGSWYCIEAHVRLNDAGQSNGEFDLWIDDRLEASKSGMNWLGSFSAYGINAVFFENYWNAGSPRAQERYFDDIVVSTERIGC